MTLTKMWKWPIRGRVGHPKVQAANAGNLRPIALLRTELLQAASVYGVCLTLLDGDDDVSEWLEWLDWYREVVEKLGEDVVREGGLDDQPEWLGRAIRAVEDADEAELLIDEQQFSDWARVEFERLAVLARPIELESGEPLGEIVDRSSGAGIRLFGLIQDSLVLTNAPDVATREMRAGPAEVREHLRAARDEGVWELLTA